MPLTDAAAVALAGTEALRYNAYKYPLGRTLLRRALPALTAEQGSLSTTSQAAWLSAGFCSWGGQCHRSIRLSGGNKGFAEVTEVFNMSLGHRSRLVTLEGHDEEQRIA